MVVRAKTYESVEYDREPEDITGELVVRHVDALDYDQHLVDGVPVDPDTVEKIDDDSE